MKDEEEKSFIRWWIEFIFDNILAFGLFVLLIIIVVLLLDA